MDDSTPEIRSLDDPSVSIEDAIRSEMLGPESEAGVRVTTKSAMTLTAFFACVRIIAETVAGLPLNVYERLEKGRRLAADHPAYPLLHDEPNNLMTSLVFRETLMSHVLMTGNAFAAIGFDGNGDPIEMLPLDPSDVQVGVRNGRKFFVVRSGGVPTTLDDSQVLHIPGLGFNGLIGYSVMDMIRNAIGLGLAAERYGAKVFRNDASVGVVIEYPDKMSDKAYERLKNSWRARYGGANAHSTAILEEGAKLQRLGLPPQDALFLEGRKFQVEEIARFFRVPPHMLASLDRATNNNIEQQALDFEKHTLRRWLIAWEQECNRKLVRREDRRRYYVEHNIDGLLRGDISARYQAYATGRQWGWLSANDVLAKENMDPIEGGDVYLVPVNMMPAQQAVAMATQPPTQPEPDANNPQRMRPIIADAVRRLMRVEIDAVGKASKGGDYATTMAEFAAEHGKSVFRYMAPIAESLSRSTPDLVDAYLRIREGFDPEADTDNVADSLIRSL